jgi:hypothetical protein
MQRPLVRSSAVLICLVGSLSSGAHSGFAQTPGDGFEFAGVHRARYETLDPQFRPGLSNSDQALALQTSLTFDWRKGELQVFGEIMDSRTLLNDFGSFTGVTTTNTFEPIQAFVAWRRGRSTLRFGRVTQDLGKRRLVARNRYRNTLNNFTGFDWLWSGEDGQSLRLLHWIPMRLLPSDLEDVLDNEFELDRGTRDARFTGLFYQFPALADGHRLEAFAFDYDLNPAADAASAANHLSLGTRAYRPRKAGEWNYEVEAVLQRGDSGGIVGGVARRDLDHEASFLHIEFGYAFDRPWEPNLLLIYDRASGDKDPTDLSNERFNTLFGARRFDFGPTGVYGIAWRGNIDSPGVRLTFRPQPKWQTMLAYRSLRLAAARDIWQGAGWRDTSGAAGRSIGRHLEGSFTWTAIPERLEIEVAFAHLFAARFPKHTAGPAFRGDPQSFYVVLTTTF